jgi:hypothetical protein
MVEKRSLLGSNAAYFGDNQTFRKNMYLSIFDRKDKKPNESKNADVSDEHMNSIFML